MRQRLRRDARGNSIALAQAPAADGYNARAFVTALLMSRPTPDLLISPRWLIPVVPHGTVLENHSLLIGGGRILDILPTGAQHFADVREVTLPGHALIPGLINMHTHAAMNLMRGIADDLPLMEWLEQHIWPLEGRFVDAHYCRVGVRHAIAEMLRGGVTCFNDMYFFPESTAAEAAAAGMRAQVGMMLIDAPTNYGQGPEDYFSKGLALHDTWHGDSLISTCFAPHAPYTVGDDTLKRCRVLADELGVGIHMHVHETAFEVDSAVSTTGLRPIQRLEQLGLLNSRLLAVHMTQLNQQDIAAVAAAGAHVLHCPESNLKLASGFCPTDALAQAGVNVALGTDGAASNNDLDVLGEMRTAALLAKAVAQRADALPAADALAMATINAARALGRDDIGSLEPGKWADLCAIDLSGLEQQPMYDPISQIVYACNRNQVTHTWVAGRALMRERKLTTLDTEVLAQQVDAYRAKIAGADHEH